MPDDVIAGRYRLLEPLGSGAMASVWLAEDSELGRRVALKLLRPDADRERFEREARAVANLSHPNVCKLYDFGEADGKPFMVLEFLSGGSLEDRLRAGHSLPDHETQRIAADVAQGLAHAHERGLVHRDLKPGNVLFDSEGRAKIADFGIVRLTGSGTITDTGTVLGTAAYISPEQTGGEPVTSATDVYSFGVILFQMLTGRLPFESRSALDLIRQHRSEPPPPVTAFRHDAPPALAALTLAALAKRPEDRPADGAALVAALAEEQPALQVTGAAEAQPTIVIPAPRSRAKVARNTLLLVAVLVLLLAGAGLALLSTRSGSGGVGTTLPPESSVLSTPTTTSSTEASTSTEETTTAPTTTEATTPTTTRRTTTAPTTAPATTTPTTTEATTETSPVTTDTTVTTTVGTVTT